MNITHLGHACLVVHIEGTRVLIDPGAFSRGVDELHEIDAVLITHKHFDHFDTAAVERLLERNPDAVLVVEPSTAAEVPDSIRPERVQVVQPGDEFTVGAGLPIKAVGGDHAIIHPDVPLIPNIGYFFPSVGLLHPGDEFSSPAEDVLVLALPISGPWQALSDAVEYLRDVNPGIAFPIHEGVLSKPEIYNNYLNQLKPAQTQFVVLEHGIETPLGTAAVSRMQRNGA
ncbi:MAG: MBL fold metallo-hydrolase [Hyphomicrobiales bacterium]|nr:MAG: MBL fold metallo-hydrolase [Hyphomicrobiales bacterium]